MFQKLSSVSSSLTREKPIFGSNYQAIDFFYSTLAFTSLTDLAHLLLLHSRRQALRVGARHGARRFPFSVRCGARRGSRHVVQSACVSWGFTLFLSIREKNPFHMVEMKNNHPKKQQLKYLR
jgi:hypothetical protein